MMTKTQLAYAARKQAQNKWVHTFKRVANGDDKPMYLEGIVEKHGAYVGCTRFEVRRKTGVTYDIEAHRLERAELTAAPGGKAGA